MDAETLAALERAVAVQAERGHDEPLIRALIKRERSGGERAKVVAWLRGEVPTTYCDPQYEIGYRLADAIASGAHEEQQP